MLDMKFDAITRDEIDDGHGSPVLTPHADTMVMHQLLCHAGECWHSEQLGSRLHDRVHLQPNPVALGKETARVALAVIARRGRIADVEIEAELQGPGRLVMATRFRDVSTGAVVTTKVPGRR